jgi:hypothetical protein
LPEALLDAGLAERLGAARFGRIEPPPYDPRRDAATKLLNPQGIADYSRAIADAVARVRGEGKFPVVLGGDCSILLGCMSQCGVTGARDFCSSTAMPISTSPRPNRMARLRRWNWRSRPGAAGDRDRSRRAPSARA